MAMGSAAKVGGFALGAGGVAVAVAGKGSGRVLAKIDSIYAADRHLLYTHGVMSDGEIPYSPRTHERSMLACYGKGIGIGAVTGWAVTFALVLVASLAAAPGEAGQALVGAGFLGAIGGFVGGFILGSILGSRYWLKESTDRAEENFSQSVLIPWWNRREQIKSDLQMGVITPEVAAYRLEALMAGQTR